MTVHSRDALHLAGVTAMAFVLLIGIFGLGALQAVVFGGLVFVPALLSVAAAYVRSPAYRAAILLPSAVALWFAAPFVAPLPSAVLASILVFSELREAAHSARKGARTSGLRPRCPRCNSLVDAATRGRSGAFQFFIEDVETEGGQVCLHGRWLSGLWCQGQMLLVQTPDGGMANLPSHKVSLRPGSSTDQPDVTLIVSEPLAALNAGTCISGRL